MRRLTEASFVCAATALAFLLMPLSASAQELEPGAYWPLPAGLNIVTVVNSFNWGDLAFDPAAPIDEASARINTTSLSFTRAFSLAGRSANAGGALPVIGGHVEGLYLGEPAEVGRFGQGDPRLRLAMNLYGAPAMTPRAFAVYQQQTIVGVSLSVAPPLGQYDSTKLINLGTNRWSFKPEVGFSRTRGQWVVEGMAGVWLFTDNTEFVGGRTREQDPIVAVQFHRHLQVQAHDVAGWGCQLLHGRTDDDWRPAEPRPPAQLAHRRHLFDSDRSRPRHSSCREPRRVHDDRR